MPPQEPQELSGWKEIAVYLGVGVRTAQDYEKNLNLPVHRQPGEKGRVFAAPGELEAWRRQTSSNAAPVPAEVPIAAPPPIAARPVTTRTFLLAAFAAVPVFALGAYLLLPHGPPADFQVEGKSLIVVNDRGKELWRHPFDAALIGDGPYLPANKMRYGWLGDLEGNGQEELLFAARTVNEAEVGNQLICFAADGRIKWQFTPGRSVTNAGGLTMVPPYLISGLLVVVGKTPADTRIVVSSTHHMFDPNQVAFLDIHGKVVGEYWHPGHLRFLEAANLHHDGRMRLLLAGADNANHQATLVVLDPLKIVGQSTPKEMRDHKFELLGMPPAKEEAVVLFPRSCFSAGQPYTRANSLRVTKERLVLTVAESVLEERSPWLTYEFDYDLNVLSVTAVAADVVYTYQALQAGGAVNHSLPEECARLKSAVVVRRN